MWLGFPPTRIVRQRRSYYMIGTAMQSNTILSAPLFSAPGRTAGTGRRSVAGDGLVRHAFEVDFHRLEQPAPGRIVLERGLATHGRVAGRAEVALGLALERHDGRALVARGLLAADVPHLDLGDRPRVELALGQ